MYRKWFRTLQVRHGSFLFPVKHTVSGKLYSKRPSHLIIKPHRLLKVVLNNNSSTNVGVSRHLVGVTRHLYRGTLNGVIGNVVTGQTQNGNDMVDLGTPSEIHCILMVSPHPLHIFRLWFAFVSKRFPWLVSQDLPLALCGQHEPTRAHGANMDQHGPTWANMGQHGPTCANMGQHGPTRTNTGQHGPTWANMGQHGPTWAKMGQHGPIWANMGQHGPTLDRKSVV